MPPIFNCQTRYIKMIVSEKLFDRHKNPTIHRTHASTEREKEFDTKVAALDAKAILEINSIEDEIVKELNQKHAVVHIDQFFILTEKGTDFTLGAVQK